jgi:hypothetical protein
MCKYKTLTTCGIRYTLLLERYTVSGKIPVLRRTLRVPHGLEANTSEEQAEVASYSRPSN